MNAMFLLSLIWSVFSGMYITTSFESVSQFSTVQSMLVMFLISIANEVLMVLFYVYLTYNDMCKNNIYLNQKTISYKELNKRFLNHLENDTLNTFINTTTHQVKICDKDRKEIVSYSKDGIYEYNTVYILPFLDYVRYYLFGFNKFEKACMKNFLAI